MLDPTHGAPGPPPPTPRLAVCPPPHPIGHLEGHLAGRRRVTWSWVSPLSPISPLPPEAPFHESRHASSTSCVLGVCRGSSLLPATPFSPPVSPSFSPPLSLPTSPPLSPPSPLSSPWSPSSSPSSPSSPSFKASRRWASASSPVRKRSSPGTRMVPPPPSPLVPYDTTHHSPGSNSSSQSPHTLTWLTVPPLAPSAQGTYRVSPKAGTFS